MTNSGASAFAWSCDIQGGEVNRGEPVINSCRGVFEEGVNDEQGFGKVLGASNRPSRADVVLKEVREKHERGIAIAHVPFRSERAGNMRGIRTAVAWRWDKWKIVGNSAVLTKAIRRTPAANFKTKLTRKAQCGLVNPGLSA